MGKVGEGPQEFITGGISQIAIDNRFFADDANGKTKGFLSLDSLILNKETFVPLSDSEQLSRPVMTELAKDLFVGITENGDKDYFKIKNEAQNADLIAEVNDMILKWSDKYKITVEKVPNKNTYYVIGFKS